MKSFRNIFIAFTLGYLFGLNLGLIKRAIADFKNCSVNASGNIYALDCESRYENTSN